ncbi:HalOD1 output domain-containing protein [Halobaculum lipolyticum]|uniref:HalOD1 output domain-containing protein n=1 Tax=Halobaculum lipolyticum TaxID=3032001 RepID=A0ABD5W8C5_9EURY|nr:HalOD1 output domain-containing protein [Halobaculum sp. DT31]
MRTAEDDVCRTVVAAVAAALDVRPMQLDTTLYEAIDPDALQRLVPCDGPSAAGVTVTFTWAGCTVTVEGSGRVVVGRLASE